MERHEDDRTGAADSESLPWSPSRHRLQKSRSLRRLEPSPSSGRELDSRTELHNQAYSTIETLKKHIQELHNLREHMESKEATTVRQLRAHINGDAEALTIDNMQRSLARYHASSNESQNQVATAGLQRVLAAEVARVLVIMSRGAPVGQNPDDGMTLNVQLSVPKLISATLGFSHLNQALRDSRMKCSCLEKDLEDAHQTISSLEEERDILHDVLARSSDSEALHRYHLIKNMNLANNKEKSNQQQQQRQQPSVKQQSPSVHTYSVATTQTPSDFLQNTRKDDRKASPKDILLVSVGAQTRCTFFDGQQGPTITGTPSKHETRNTASQTKLHLKQQSKQCQTEDNTSTLENNETLSQGGLLRVACETTTSINRRVHFNEVVKEGKCLPCDTSEKAMRANYVGQSCEAIAQTDRIEHQNSIMQTDAHELTVAQIGYALLIPQLDATTQTETHFTVSDATVQTGSPAQSSTLVQTDSAWADLESKCKQQNEALALLAIKHQAQTTSMDVMLKCSETENTVQRKQINDLMSDLKRGESKLESLSNALKIAERKLVSFTETEKALSLAISDATHSEERVKGELDLARKDIENLRLERARLEHNLEDQVHKDKVLEETVASLRVQLRGLMKIPRSTSCISSTESSNQVQDLLRSATEVLNERLQLHLELLSTATSTSAEQPGMLRVPDAHWPHLQARIETQNETLRSLQNRIANLWPLESLDQSQLSSTRDQLTKVRKVEAETEG